MTLSADSNSKTLNPIPTANNGLSSSMSTLTATTNVPTGYNLTLFASTTPALTTTSGTIASPIALENNTWGYALARTSAVGVVNNFDTSYAIPTPSVSSKWANPRTRPNPTIKNTATAATNDITNIYYGAKVNMSLPKGTYINTVTYTATTNTSTMPAPSIISVTPSTGTTAGGTQVAIVGTGFAINNQSVTTGITIDGQTCTSFSLSSNTPTTGKDTITCTTPAHAAGAVNVQVTTWKGTATSTNSYTYVTPASVSFVSPSTLSTTPGTESGPALTIAGTNFTGATSVTIGGTPCTNFQVVSDTHIFCKAPNTITTTGQKVIQVTKPGIPSTSTTSVTYNNTNYPTLQASNAFSQCTTTAKLFRDTRDSQLYYVKKMPDNKCWMVDNLKYANYGTLSQEVGKYLTVNGTNTANATNFDVAKYVDPGAVNYCKGNTNIPTNTNTRCGLLYNWYAATNGTGTYAQNTNGTNVTGSICPANFRLPSGTSNGSTATGNGTSATAADFPVLNASMNAGSLTTGSMASSYYAGWQPTGAWGGAFSGYWDDTLGTQSSSGSFWSSTVSSATTARYLVFHSSSIDPGYSANYSYNGFSVRCVMESPVVKTGDAIQTVNTQNCPTTRTRVNDARDNASYWIQKMADNRCWMLTNLAYGGGGDNAYGDAKSITNNESLTYTAPYYMIPADSNKTTGTTDPSTSTDGGTTNPQYGYLYNWCAAMGAQTTTSACANATTPAPDQNISVCPAGWRLPTSNTRREYQTLTDAIGATTNGSSGGTAGSTSLRSTWLAQYSGPWYLGFTTQGSNGYFWSSSQYGADRVYYLSFLSSLVYPSSNGSKRGGYAVRCIAE